MKPPMILLLCLGTAILATTLGATTYTGTFTNSTSYQYIAWHIDCSNGTPDFYTVKPNIYNTSQPGTKWIIYPFEQGSNYYQRSGFLAYPPDGSNAQLDPGETLSVTFNYTSATTPAIDQFPVTWPLDGTTLTVTPESMQGWSIETNSGAKASIATYGPGVWEANRSLVAEEQNIHLGRGSYHAELDYSGGPGSSATPATAWLGLDTFSGRSLTGILISQIKTMKYFAFQSKIPSMTSHEIYWDSWSVYWEYPRQPICMELTAEHPTTLERRQFWFSPWNATVVSGDYTGRQSRRWLWYDCLNGTPQVAVTRRWYVYRGLDGQGNGLDEQYASWANLVAVYGTWRLVATSNDPWPAGYRSAGWDTTTDPPGSPSCTATGKCLNFQVGARKGEAVVYTMEGTSPVNWASYYWGLRANLDLFTLGIDLNSDGDDTDAGERYNYDFEPSPTEPDVTKVYVNHKSVSDAVIGAPVIQSGYELRDHGPVLDYCPTMIFGKVVAKSNVYFALDDGSGLEMPVRVWLIRNQYNYYESPRYTWPKVGEYWCVWGWIEKPRFFPDTPKPTCMWTSIYNCKKVF